jgi:hypothetical protein
METIIYWHYSPKTTKCIRNEYGLYIGKVSFVELIANFLNFFVLCLVRRFRASITFFLYRN